MSASDSFLRVGRFGVRRHHCRHRPTGRRQNRPCFLQIFRFNACNCADKLVTRLFSVDKLIDQLLRRFEISAREKDFIFQLIFGYLPSQFVQVSETICDRIGAHRQHGRANFLPTVRNPRCIELSVHLFVGNLFCKILNPFDFLLRVRIRPHAVQAQFAMQSHLDGYLLYAERQLRCFVRIGLIILPNLRLQIFELSAHLRFHEGGREIRDRRGIRPSFRHHALADVADGVVIKMRNVAHQSVRPVVIAQCHLLLRRKLQTAVRAEVQHRVSLEIVLRPEVCGDVSMRRRRFGSVNNRKSIASKPRHRLWQQRNISQPDTGYGKILFVVLLHRHIRSRRLSVGAYHFRIQRFGQRLLRPRFVGLLLDEHRIPIPQKIIKSALGIRT